MRPIFLYTFIIKFPILCQKLVKNVFLNSELAATEIVYIYFLVKKMTYMYKVLYYLVRYGKYVIMKTKNITNMNTNMTDNLS